MGCSILVTETVIREYRFDSEEEARTYFDNGDLWIYDSEVIESEILQVEILPDPDVEIV